MKTVHLKLLVVLSFLFIIIPGNMFALPMIIAILGIFSNSSDNESLYLIPAFLALVYLLISANSNQKNKLSSLMCFVCLFVLFITDIYALLIIVSNFNYVSVITFFIHLLFWGLFMLRLIKDYRQK